MTKKVKTQFFGKTLVDRGVITQEQLQETLIAQQNSNLRIGQLVIKRGLAAEEDILMALGEHHNIEASINIEFNDSEKIFGNIPLHFLKKNKIVPFKTEKQMIYVAIVDALNIQPLDDLKMLFPNYHFEPVLTTDFEIQRIITSHYSEFFSESTEDVIDDLEEADLEILSTTFMETEDLMDMANDAPIIRLVNTFFKQAIDDRASDIHIEPYEKDLIVRFRIDGILYQMFTPPKKFQNAIISRVKIMANLNIAENRLPQDGRIQIKVGGKDIDIRVSTFPIQYGERIVMRLLNKADMIFDLKSLGLNKKNLKSFNDQIEKTHGIILVTGPTGSGKTTTLYSVLSQLNTVDVNILTVEDPVEYQLKGIGQMQVKSNIDLTFAAGLRSILRQDPDIVMIGEIRDIETAEIAVQSALTGHRVFSTLHTNDAPSGITRLLDMGVEPFLITSSLNAILAQRLVRKICPNCKQSYKPTVNNLKELKIKQTQLKGGKLYRGKGCTKCLKTGYIGRLGIYEQLTISQGIRRLIMNNADSETIKELALKEGMITLREDGLQKAIEGITTVEEVVRVS